MSGLLVLTTCVIFIFNAVNGYSWTWVLEEQISLLKSTFSETGEIEETFEGLTAFAIQHEIDHLRGKLFIDDLSPLKKQRVRKKVEKTLRRTRWHSSFNTL